MIEKLLGERLVAENRLTEEQLASALQRQRQHGGRIGDNLVALGYLNSEELDGLFKTHPAPPRTIEETGLELTFIADLLLKHASSVGNFTIMDMIERVHLGAAILDDVLDYLKRQKYVEVKGSPDYSRLKYRYSLTNAGTARASEQLEICR
jgi:hypothetical protein